MLILLNRLKQYNPSNLKKIKAKEETKRATTKLYINRQDIIKAFKTGVFPYIDGFKKKNKNQKKNQKDLQRTKIRDELNKFIEHVEDESKDMNYDLFKRYFNYSVPSDLTKKTLWNER